jgi:hypothetical protein
MQPTIATYLEGAAAASSPGAIEWPSWCRRRRDEDEAQLERQVARLRGLVGVAPFAAPTDPSALEVVERQEGNTTTDFH